MSHADGWRDGKVAALAGAQRTIVSHQQLIALGCGPHVIAHWVKRGRVHIVFHGVYSIVSGELPRLAREQAALLACREHSFLSHQTAAAIWGLRRVLPVEIEVSVVGRYCSSRKGIRIHRVQSLDRREVQQHEGLWVSSPARAILEIAATLSPRELAYAINDGLAAGVLDRREIDAVLVRHRGCRGAGRLATALATGSGTIITRSRAERAFLKLVRDAGLPMPEVNQPFGRWELDFIWRKERLVVEIDGYRFHSGPASFNSNHEKDLAVRKAGLDLLRFTRDHVVNQGMMALATVAGELARRVVGDQ